MKRVINVAAKSPPKTALLLCTVSHGTSLTLGYWPIGDVLDALPQGRSTLFTLTLSQ